MVVVQGSYAGTKGDSWIGCPYEQNGIAREPGQDSEAAKRRKAQQGIYGPVPLQVLTPCQYLLPVHLVHHEPRLLRTHSQHERAWWEYLRELGEWTFLIKRICCNDGLFRSVSSSLLSILGDVFRISLPSLSLARSILILSQFIRDHRLLLFEKLSGSRINVCESGVETGSTLELWRIMVVALQWRTTSNEVVNFKRGAVKWPIEEDCSALKSNYLHRSK